MDQKGRLRFAEAPSRLPRRRTYVQSYFLKLEQPNAVFTAYTPGWIALGSGATTGGLRAFRDNVAYLQQADMYRVISPLPYLTPDELRDDRVDVSDGAYLVPPPVPDRVRALANDIVEGTTTDYDRAARLERFLLTQYPYDLRTPPAPTDVDAVDYFLFTEQRGYCTQFATAMAVLGRLVGLPTRVAVGYLPGKYNSLTAIHEVRYQDAHAWAEVRFTKHGWVPFDPTPSPNSPWDMAASPWLPGSSRSYAADSWISLSKVQVGRWATSPDSGARCFWWCRQGRPSRFWHGSHCAAPAGSGTKDRQLPIPHWTATNEQRYSKSTGKR